MNCRSAKRGHNCVDEILRDGELSQFEAHQLECESCELQSSDLRAIRSALQMLPRASPPRIFARVCVSPLRRNADCCLRKMARGFFGSAEDGNSV